MLTIGYLALPSRFCNQMLTLSFYHFSIRSITMPRIVE
jgi:hypothetical protein